MASKSSRCFLPKSGERLSFVADIPNVPAIYFYTQYLEETRLSSHSERKDSLHFPLQQSNFGKYLVLPKFI